MMSDMSFNINDNFADDIFPIMVSQNASERSKKATTSISKMNELCMLNDLDLNSQMTDIKCFLQAELQQESNLIVSMHTLNVLTMICSSNEDM